MFEKELEDKFKSIFQINKVTFAEPSDSREQECIFIEIEDAKINVKDKRCVGMVSGNGKMYGQSEKLPFGFFKKQIDKADKSLTKKLFFFDLEQNTKIFQNLIERKFSFIYFFNSQFDPNLGIITSVEFTEES